MSQLLKDIYTVAYRFARTVNSNGTLEGAMDYAKNICAVWLSLVMLFAVVLAGALFEIQNSSLLGKNRWELLIVTVVMFITGSMLAGSCIQKMPELKLPEAINDNYERMAGGMKLLVSCLVVGPVVGILLFSVARYYWGWFGGYE